MSQPKSRSSKNNFLNKWIGKKNQLGQMFRGSDLNYTAAITTKCPHFLQIVLQNKLTREYPWQPKIRDLVSFELQKRVNTQIHLQSSSTTFC